MTATPPRADPRTLAADLAQVMRDANTPDAWDVTRGLGPNFVPFGHFAEVALEWMRAAVLPEHRRMVLTEAADYLAACQQCEKIHQPREDPDGRYAPSWASPDDGHAYRPRDERSAEAIRRLAAAAPPAGLSAPVPAETAPAVPEEADGQRTGGEVRCACDDFGDGECVVHDALTYAEMEADRDRLAAQVAHCQRVVEAAKAWRAARPGPWVSGTDVEFHLFAAVDALPDAGTDQTEGGRG